MADLHPEVQGLLDSLLISGLLDLGRLAMDRVLNGDHIDRDDQDGFSTGAPKDPRRQLALVDKAVTEVLKLEIELAKRTQEVLGEFRELQAFRAGDDAARALRPTMLETIVMLGAEDGDDEAAASRQEKPLSNARLERLERLLEAWRRGVDDAWRRLET